MRKEYMLFNIIKDKGRITSKEVTELGYPRIYLNFLIKENLIYKIDRGVYSINKTDKTNPLIEFQKNNKKIIYSGFTALKLLGFISKWDKDIQISVPQGYNASRYSNCLVFYNSSKTYNIGVSQVIVEGVNLKIYDLERSICDIIKNKNRFNERDYNKLINYYFNQNSLNYNKLLEYSKLLNVSKTIQHYLSLFKA